MRKPILYINACVRQESRTKRLAEKLLLKLGESYEEIRLDETVFPVVNEEYLCKRDQLYQKVILRIQCLILQESFQRLKSS